MSLFREIHRRSLWQILGIYLAASWLVLQVVETLGETIGLPEWFGPVAFGLLLIGLPVVLATAFTQGGGPGRARPTIKPFADPDRPASEPESATPRPAAEAAAPVGAHHRLFTWRNAIAGAVIAFAILGAGTLAWNAMRTMGIGPAGTLVAKGVLEERAVVLLTDFDAADPVLSRTATEAFRVDLSQSSAIRLAEPSRIQAALRRMEQDPDVALDADLGLQLAEREGITAIVSGEITAAGGRYLLTASIVTPGDGLAVTSQRETASDSTDLIPAIDRLSKKLRERIGDSMREIGTSPPLAQVTTSNLEALRKYSEAMQIIRRKGESESAVIILLEEAVKLDTAFATAWRSLGVRLRNRGQEPARMVEALTRAYEQGHRLTERERYAARGMYFGHVTREHEKAAAEFQRQLELEPEDLSARNYLAVEYTELRDFDGAAELFEQNVRDDPGHWNGLYNIIEIWADLGRFDEASAMLDTARARFGETVDIGWTAAHLAATMEEHATAELLLRRLDDSAPGDLVAQAIGGSDLAALAGAQGKVSDADAYLTAAIEANRARNLGGEVIADAVQAAWLDVGVRENAAAGIARLDGALTAHPLEDLQPLDRPYLSLAQVFARAGDPDRAEAFVADFESAVPASLHSGSILELERARGEIAMARGQYDEAIAAFERSDKEYCVICALPGLALAYDRAGNTAVAIDTYERYATTPWFYRFFGEVYDQGPLLGPAIERVAQLADEMGDLETAAEFYAKFVELWAYADEELQPRVAAAQARLEEILEARG